MPGLGKTLLVRTLGEVLDLSFNRIQFTPDLMPADILGTNIVMEIPGGRREFQFQRGPIFAHLVLDEEESKAWELTTFPHLLLPDLVEMHIANLDLRPVETKYRDLFSPHHCEEIGHRQHAFAA